MANELDYDFGIDVTLIFPAANPSANTTTNLTFAQGNGFVVPTGYKFHPILISASSNADLTAGTATAVVRATPSGGSIGTVANAPTVELSDTVQRGTGVARVGPAGIAADSIVQVGLVTTSDYAPTTADLDVVLVGKLLPA